MNTPRPEWADEYGASYGRMVESWGFKVLNFSTVGSYQGDHLVLLADGARRGFLVIGYGSCSGCDALQAAEPWGYDDDEADWTDLVKLSDQLRDEIEWRDSGADMAAYLSGLDPANAWWLHEDESPAIIRRYVSEVLA